MLVFLHGGYWQELSAVQSRFAAASCLAAGHAFAAVDYTLAPQATLPEIVGECKAAWARLANEARSLGLDPNRMVVSGSSAGAHLAAMLCLPGAMPAAVPAPAAAVLVSGIYRLEPLLGTSINKPLGLDLNTARRMSPQLQALTGFAPAFIGWGQHETTAFKAQSRHFAGALQLSGVRCSIAEVPARNHFDIILDLAEPGTLLGDTTLTLLDTHIRGPHSIDTLALPPPCDQTTPRDRP